MGSLFSIGLGRDEKTAPHSHKTAAQDYSRIPSDRLFQVLVSRRAFRSRLIPPDHCCRGLFPYEHGPRRVPL